MPDRIVRAGILTSDRVNALSWAGEVFYRRLMSVVDDFGRYDGRLSVIRGAIYSLKLDRVSDSDIGKWIRECEEAGLVRRYTVEDKPFIELPKFGQKIRAKFSKWPDPPTSANTCQQVSADASVVVFEVGDVIDKKLSSGKPDLPPGFVRFWTAWPKTERKQGKAKCLEIWKRKKLEAQADGIVLHVERMAQSESWRTGFDPMPTTYLNEMRWDGAELDSVGKTAMGECQWNVNGNRDPDAGKCPHAAVGLRNNVPYCQTHLGQVH
jgi:hypothetical protein